MTLGRGRRPRSSGSVAQPLDRLGQRDIELARIGREQGHRQRIAFAQTQHLAEHRLEIMEVAVHILAE